MFEIAPHINDINRLCSLYGVKHLYAFGSVLTNKFNAQSDIDFLVDFLPLNSADYADNYYNFKYSLEEIFKRNIDLLEEKAIRNPYLMQAINSNKKVVYGN